MPRQKRPQKPPARPHGVAAWQAAVALSLLRTGSTCAAAADHAGVSPGTAARLSRAYHLPVRPRGRAKGEAGIPLPIRAAALRMVRDGMTYVEAGKAVGVSKQAVYRWAVEAGVTSGKGRRSERARKGLVEKGRDFA